MFHFCNASAVVVVLFSRWRHVKDAVFCMAAGSTVSPGNAVCILASFDVTSCCFLSGGDFVTVIHCGFMMVIWNNVQSCVFSWGRRVKRNLAGALENKRKKAFMCRWWPWVWKEMPEPQNHWGEYRVLSTWGMLLHCCLVRKEAISLCTTSKTMLPPRLSTPDTRVKGMTPKHFVAVTWTFIQMMSAEGLWYSTSEDNNRFPF